MSSDWILLLLVGLVISLSVNIALLLVDIEPLNPKKTIYKTKVECIHKENRDCEKKYIKSYIPKGESYDN